MIQEYIVSKEEIRSLNEVYGGSLRMDTSIEGVRRRLPAFEIETALSLGKGKGIYRKVAYLWKAILVGHPFTDGNKRTALMVAVAMLEKCGIKLDGEKKENIVSEIRKIASENITDINTIERSIRYAVTGA